MTAGAVDCEAEKSLSHDADHVLHFLFASDGALSGVRLAVARLVPWPAHKQTGADDAIAGHGLEHIASDLFLHEAVVRLVVVEALDDVIPVVPRVLAEFVVLEALALGVTRHVQPVASPTF